MPTAQHVVYTVAAAAIFGRNHSTATADRRGYKENCHKHVTKKMTYICLKIPLQNIHLEHSRVILSVNCVVKTLKDTVLVFRKCIGTFQITWF